MRLSISLSLSRPPSFFAYSSFIHHEQTPVRLLPLFYSSDPDFIRSLSINNQIESLIKEEEALKEEEEAAEGEKQVVDEDETGGLSIPHTIDCTCFSVTDHSINRVDEEEQEQ